MLLAATLPDAGADLCLQFGFEQLLQQTAARWGRDKASAASGEQATYTWQWTMEHVMYRDADYGDRMHVARGWNDKKIDYNDGVADDFKGTVWLNNPPPRSVRARSLARSLCAYIARRMGSSTNSIPVCPLLWLRNFQAFMCVQATKA